MAPAGGKAPGRGAYLWPAAACVAAARKKRLLERALKGPVPPSVYEGLEGLAPPPSGGTVES